MTPEVVSQALANLVEERAERGNAQSKHGVEAAELLELFYLIDQLDKILGDPSR